jgi:hypothetical protein
MKFYIGLFDPPHIEKLRIPYMMSVRRLMNRKSTVWGEDWLMDSGGFTELSLRGKYEISEDEYIETIQRFRPTIAFCQDWMCEAPIIAKTGLDIKTHQHLSLVSYLSMKERTPRVAPVLQGYELEDYVIHAEVYEKAKVKMNQVFGIGSICRRSTTDTPVKIILALKKRWPNIKLHAFGLKTTAFKDADVVRNLWSADSLAWSFWGRKNNPLPCEICVRKTFSCQNCYVCAKIWLKRLQEVLDKHGMG